MNLENLPNRRPNGNPSAGNRRITDSPSHGWLVAILVAGIVAVGMLASALL